MRASIALHMSSHSIYHAFFFFFFLLLLLLLVVVVVVLVLVLVLVVVVVVVVVVVCLLVCQAEWLRRMEMAGEGHRLAMEAVHQHDVLASKQQQEVWIERKKKNSVIFRAPLFSPLMALCPSVWRLRLRTVTG